MRLLGNDVAAMVKGVLAGEVLPGRRLRQEEGGQERRRAFH